MAAVPCLCSSGWVGCVWECHLEPAKKDLDPLCGFVSYNLVLPCQLGKLSYLPSLSVHDLAILALTF